ncbi:MAG: DegT/DnrJ/EryC1/StrS family aminotransferase [Acidimicrobiia bacterium]
MTEPISIAEVRLGAHEEQLALEVLRSGHLVQGPMVDRLERAFAELCSVQHGIAVSSGTTALVAALEVLGLGNGDEVVTSPFTFAATLNAILESGATARFADIDGATFTLDPVELERQMSPRTQAVIPVHLYGQPASMDEIGALATSHGASVVEDACQAHGASFRGRPVGSYGIGCFSFYATKNVVTGEGGMITTDDDEIADRLRVLRNQGMRTRYEYEVPGHNYRLTDIQAAIALPQLERLDEMTARRVQNASRLSAGLDGVTGLVTPAVTPGRTHVFHQYTVRVTREAAVDRGQLAARLEALGIGSGIYYPNVVYDFECFRRHPRVVVESMPVAEQVAREVLSLPVHPWLTDEQLDRIVASVREVLGH